MDTIQKSTHSQDKTPKNTVISNHNDFLEIIIVTKKLFIYCLLIYFSMFLSLFLYVILSMNTFL